MASIAALNTASFACEGFVNPLTFRTYWTAAHRDFFVCDDWLEVEEGSDVTAQAP
jgi:hypothetical protein